MSADKELKTNGKTGIKNQSVIARKLDIPGEQDKKGITPDLQGINNPVVLDSHKILLLQRSIGNLAVNQLLAGTNPVQSFQGVQGQAQDVIQRVDKHGANMSPVEQSNELFVSSNDEKCFRYGLPGNMTYHHIIPREKLSEFWNKVQKNGELKYLTSAITELIKKAKARVAATTGLENSTVFQINDAVQSEDTLNAIFKKLGLGQELSDAENAGADIIEKIYQWWPANIHHGPNSRPVGINKEEDDGGDKFEESAKYVVNDRQFTKLAKLNGLMDKYLKAARGKARVKLLKNINGLIIQLQSITTVTPFNHKRWYKVPSGAEQGKWRIKSKV